MTTPTREGIVPWPAADGQRYREAGYWQDRSLFSFIRESGDRTPDAIAVVDGDSRITYRELVSRAEGCARDLLELGFEPDDRVLVQLPNTWEFIALTIALLSIGVIPVMALPAHRSHELEYLAALSESRAIIVPDEHREFDHQRLAEDLRGKVPSVDHVIVLGKNVNDGNINLRDLLRVPSSLDEVRAALEGREPSGDDVAVFLLSGGTTGLPKLITRTNNDYVYNVQVTSIPAEISSDTVYFIALPASHNFPLACPGFLGTLFVGGRVVMSSSPEPARSFELIEKEHVTITAVVPAVAQRWIEYQENVGGTQLKSLQVLQVGGSRLADELAVKVKPVLGATLQQVFGMAEGLINMTRLDDPEDVIVGTQGRPVSVADEIVVVDEEGEFLPDGSIGVLLTRGPYTPRGYFRAEEHNAKSFTPEGWYISGDIVELRLDHNLVVRGRQKDMINRGGEKVSGEEVENFVYQFPQVTLAAAVAMPDPVVGERVCIYVVLRAGTTLELDDVRRAMNEAGVAAFKLPERLLLVEELPLTKIGKIDKKLLREDVAARMAAS